MGGTVSELKTGGPVVFLVSRNVHYLLESGNGGVRVEQGRRPGDDHL